MAKTCRVCGKVVNKGEGTYFRGMLVHKSGCLGTAKAYPWRFKD